MTLLYTSFINCCGAGIIYGFALDTATETEFKKQEAWLDKSFSEKYQPGFVQLNKVGFVFAILNHGQLHSEPQLIKHGFIQVGAGINNVHNSKIYTYLRTTKKIEEVVKPKKIVNVTRAFGDKNDYL